MRTFTRRPPCADRRGHPAPGRAQRRAQLRDDPALERAALEQPRRRLDPDLLDDLAVEDQPRDIGQEEEPPGTQPERERGGRRVRVDVERSDGERRDDHDPCYGYRIVSVTRKLKSEHQGKGKEFYSSLSPAAKEALCEDALATRFFFSGDAMPLRERTGFPSKWGSE